MGGEEQGKQWGLRGFLSSEVEFRMGGITGNKSGETGRGQTIKDLAFLPFGFHPKRQ